MIMNTRLAQPLSLRRLILNYLPVSIRHGSGAVATAKLRPELRLEQVFEITASP